MKIKGVFAVATACFLLGTSVPYCAAKIADTSRTVANAAVNENETVDGMRFTLKSEYSGYELTSLVDKYREGDIVIPATINDIPVVSIADKVFYEASNIDSVEIPENVTRIGLSAFCGCTSLKSVSLPDSLTSIQHYAFKDCINLENVELPKNLTFLGQFAFENCRSLTKLTFPGSLTYVNSGVAKNCLGLRSVIVEDGITQINGSAFESCKLLADVTLPLTLKTIIYYKSNYDSNKKAYYDYVMNGLLSTGEKGYIYYYNAFLDCNVQRVCYAGNADQWDFVDGKNGNFPNAKVICEQYTPLARDLGDMNGDGYVDAKDASIILRIYSENSSGGSSVE